MSRLDRELVDRGLVASRSRAAREIAAGRVSLNGTTVTRPAHEVAASDELTIIEPDPWVARSAHKLLGALESFEMSGTLTGLTVLDAGASTGGFTQVLLHHGVSEVWAVDVGHDQLAPVLRSDARVHMREGLNLRELGDSDVPQVDLVVADVSFISLRLLLAPLLAATRTPATGGTGAADPTGPAAGERAPGELLLMVKPQFELARASLDKHGVVTEAKNRRRALDSVIAAVTDHDARVTDIAPSPLPGPSGNREYFLRVRPGRTGTQSDRLSEADIPGRLETMMRGEA